MGSVKALSCRVRNSIRSGIIVYDFTGVVEELVFNSLDAAATKVSVYVSVGSCRVKVVDDGFGISRDGLVLLGERYVTSKLLDSVGAVVANRSYGFRGEALASISDVSLVEILTKTCGKPNGYRKIIKGSKCLYLGINDDQKDVGTTVIARDLFYNQPVRRKYMLSSRKKVLDSIKKCLYRIALVNPKVSFKVVDTESEDVLLDALPSSTLSRLMTGFGIEGSESLCEVNVSDGALKLSGYVSAPCTGFSVKAFQFVYINSRFVCKGHIHKVIDNLSTSIEDMHPFNASSLSGKGKRSRPETYPAYLLNLCCPLSLYDLSFEPSKTNVEFKDWVPILAFIRKVIQQLWTGSVELLSHVDHEFKKDGIGDEYENLALVDDDNREPEPFNCGIKTNQSSYHLASSSLEVLKGEVDDMFNGECDRVSSKKYFMNDTEGEKQARKDIVLDDSPSICSRNAFFPQQTTKLSERSENDPFTSDHKFWLPTDHLLEDRFTSSERSCCHEENHILSLNWQDEPSELEFGEINQCNRNQFSFDCLGFGSELSISEDSRSPFLRSCISRRNILVDGAVFERKERFGFPIDSFRSKRKRLCADENFDISEVEGTDQTFNVFPSILQQSEARDTRLFPPGIFGLLAGASTKSFSPRKNPLAEEHDFDCGSVRQTESFGHSQFLHSGSSATSNAVFTAKAWDILRFPDDTDASEESSRLEKGDNYWHFTDGEKMSGKSSYDFKSKKCRQDNTAMSPRSSMLDFNSFPDSLSDFSTIFKRDKEPFLQLAGEEDWLSVNLFSEMYKNNEPFKVQGNQFRYKNWDQNHVLRKRSSRSHSAPPFYKCKRSFVSLNHHLMHNEGKFQETDKMKHQIFFPKSAKEPDTRNNPDNMLDKEIQKAQNFEHSESVVTQDTVAKVPEGAATSADYGSKWREHCQRIAKSHVSSAGSQHDVLNSNSGFLHLAGNLLVPESLHKSCLDDAKVLLQVDRKFIPIVGGGTLAVIDQHAADERIRLEEIRQKVLSGEARTVSYLDSEKELILPEVGYQLLHSYAEQTREWGWICNILTQNSGTFEKNLNVLHQQPKLVTLLAVPCILGVNLSDGDLLEFLQQLADTDGSSNMPPSVLRVLNYKACRGAIMFGDSLLHSECSLLVEELKQTSLCFQCAHGRPTTVPLVNLDALHKQIAKFSAVDDDSSKSWHGLCRQEISFNRAAKRLRATMS